MYNKDEVVVSVGIAAYNAEKITLYFIIIAVCRQDGK